MNHTPQIKKAIQFAARKHHGHLRIVSTEEAPMPYITHLFSVAILVAEDGASDDLVTAALLHDTIEDTGTTREEIAQSFNQHVADLVVSVSEVRERDGAKLSWKECKTEYLDRLASATDETLVIAIADKIENVESRAEEFIKYGESFLKNWRQPNASYLWFYGEALRIAKDRLPHHRLTKRYTEAFARLEEVTASVA